MSSDNSTAEVALAMLENFSFFLPKNNRPAAGAGGSSSSPATTPQLILASAKEEGPEIQRALQQKGWIPVPVSYIASIDDLLSDGAAATPTNNGNLDVISLINSQSSTAAEGGVSQGSSTTSKRASSTAAGGSSDNKKRRGRPSGSKSKNGSKKAKTTTTATSTKTTKTKTSATAAAAAENDDDSASIASLSSSASATAAAAKKQNNKKKSATKNKQQIKSEQLFESYLEQLKQYKAIHNHCNVPQTQGKLGVWVNTQRKNYKLLRDDGVVHCKDGKTRKKKSSLTPKRMQDLLDIGFNFQTTPKLSWEERVEELRKYKDEHGNFDIPNKGEYKTLHCWFDTQVRRVRVQEGMIESENTYSGPPLTPDQIQILKHMGVDFYKKGKTDSEWEKKFNLLCVYKQKHGNCLVPKKDKILGEWVLNQRKRHKQLLKKMVNNPEMVEADERIRKLNSIGFVFQLRNRSVWKKQSV